MENKISKNKSEENRQQMKKSDPTSKNRLEDFDVEEYLRSIYKAEPAESEPGGSGAINFIKQNQNIILKVLIGCCYAVIFGVLLSKFFTQ